MYFSILVLQNLTSLCSATQEHFNNISRSTAIIDKIPLHVKGRERTEN